MDKNKIPAVLFFMKLLINQGVCQPGGDQYPEEQNFLNFSVIADPKVRFYAVEFNRMCPYTHMCDVQVDVDYSIFRISGIMFEYPCCGRCGCGNDCLETLDCCPDRLPRLLTTDEVNSVYNNPQECVQAQFRPPQGNRFSWKSYLMTAKCPEIDVHTEMVENCHKEYSDFDFAADIPNFLPVTDRTTNITYKNKFCALCNRASPSALIFWEIQIGSQAYEIRIKSLSDVNPLFASDEKSNAVFLIPNKLTEASEYITTCTIYIDRCNVTGNWKEYDPEIESLCVSYLSSYKEYKNIHCYICNGFNTSSIEEICEDTMESWRPRSFVTLLDFNDIKQEETGSNDNVEHFCHNNQIYDNWAKTCRNLSCPYTTFLSQNDCRPTFSQISGASFDYTVRLVPIRGYIDVRIIPTLMKTLADDIEKDVQRSEFGDIFGSNVQMFLKLGRSGRYKSENQLNYSAFKEMINYVAIRFIIETKEIYDVKKFMKEITLHLKTLDLDITGGFDAELASISFALYEKMLQASSGVPSDPKTTPPTSSTPPLSSPTYNAFEYGILEGYLDPLDGLQILPVRPQYWYFYPNTIRLTPFLFCPTVTLNKQDFKIETTKKQIHLIRKNVYINSSDVVFSEDDSSIVLCSADYISSTDSPSKPQESSNLYNAEVILSIVCTSASMLGLVVVFVTYCVFKMLRTLPGLNNMGLSFSLFFAQLFYLTGGVFEVTLQWLCEMFGLLLHFFLLASIFWMGVCTFHMMRTFVFISQLSTAQNARSKFIKYTVFVIVSSTVFVVCNIVVSVTADSSIGYGGQSCYITRNYMVLYTVAIPLGLVIISNLVMFFYVVIKVYKLPEVKKNTKHERSNIVIFAKLSTLTGLTWIFAYIYQWTHVKAFTYLFIITNATQGLFIMFSFVINRRVFDMVQNSYKKSSFYHATHKTSGTSLTRTTSEIHTAHEKKTVGASQIHIETNHL